MGGVVCKIFVKLYDGTKRLKQAIDAGDVALVRTQQPSVALRVIESARVRLETCEAAKNIGRVLRMSTPQLFAFIHGLIKEAATGMKKKEMSKLIKKEIKSFIARDYFTDDQQNVAWLFLRALDKHAETCDVPEVLKQLAIKYAYEARLTALVRFFHYKPGEVPQKNMTVKRARNVIAAIWDAPQNAPRANKRQKRAGPLLQWLSVK